MTEISTEVQVIAIVWVVLVVLVARMTIRSAHGSVGLPTAFLLAMTFSYIGFIAYLVPGYSHLRSDGDAYLQSYGFTESTVLAGVTASVIGVAGFAVGCWLATSRRRGGGWVPGFRVDPVFRHRMMICLGACGLAGFLLNGVPIEIPMIQALAQVGRNLAIAVVCLGATLVVLVDKRSNYGGWLILGAAMPAAYLILWGFTSYGFIVFTCLAAYWLAVLAPRWLGPASLAASTGLVTYGMLSLFVAWMSFRVQLREVLWNSQATLGERLSAIATALGNADWLRPTNFSSLDWLNARLNQYVFVGKAIEWHELAPSLQLHGQTLLNALFVWIPRFLWPNKPVMGGNVFVAEHTGMTFSASATFGSGPVFELFVNFGQIGIFFGFLVLGIIVCLIDRRASTALRSGLLLEYVRWFTVGLAFIAPLTEFFFMFNTALITWVILTGLKVLLDQPDAVLPEPGSRPASSYPTALNARIRAG